MNFYLIDDYPTESDQCLHLCVGFDPETMNFVIAQDDVGEDGELGNQPSVVTMNLNEISRLGQYVEAILEALLNKEGHSVQ